MPRYFVKSNQIQCNTITIIGEDVRHIRNVLRKQIDDIIEICDQDNNNSYIYLHLANTNYMCFHLICYLSYIF